MYILEELGILTLIENITDYRIKLLNHTNNKTTNFS